MNLYLVLENVLAQDCWLLLEKTGTDLEALKKYKNMRAWIKRVDEWLRALSGHSTPHLAACSLQCFVIKVKV